MERRQPVSLKRANPVGSLVLLRSHPELWRLALIQFLAYTAHNVFGVWVLYAIYRYSWGEVTTGLSLMVVGISTGLISALLTGRMVKRFGEKTTLYIGQFFGGVGMFVAGIARNSLQFFASIPIISLWNISMPAAQSMMTHRVSEREQGELQGAIQSLRSITFIIGPFMFLRVFSRFIDPKHGVHMPGAPFYLASLLLFTAMLMSTRIRQDKAAAPESAPPPEVPEMIETEDVGGNPVAPTQL
jgi:DHA1 family tetracycline resistance protein-like MFS transporter